MGGALILLKQHLVGKFERGKAANARADDAGRAIALAVFQRHLELRLATASCAAQPAYCENLSASISDLLFSRSLGSKSGTSPAIVM